MTSVDSASLTLIVCTRSEERMPGLGVLVDSAVAELGPRDEAILVVDHNPGVRDELEARWSDDARIRVLENTAAVNGLSGARNTAVRAASGDVLIFVDDDALLLPGWAGVARESFLDPTLTVLGGAVHADWADAHRAPGWFPPEFGWVVGCDYRGLAEDGQPIRNPIGACMAVRADAFETAGLFLEALGRRDTLPVGCEETEFSIRLRQRDPRTRILRSTRWGVRHHVPRARQRARYFFSRTFWEGWSKAHVARLGGARSLQRETDHVARALTAGWRRDLRAWSSGDGDAGRRLFASIGGLAAAGTGFVLGSARTAVTSFRPDAILVERLAPRGDSTPRISLILCTIGRAASLADSVAALLAQTIDDTDVLVVDNDPRSEWASRALAGMSDPRLRIIREPQLGLSHARNAGIRAARAPIVAFTDDDALVEATWAAELLAGFDDDAVMCVTGRVVAASVNRPSERLFEAAGGFDKGDAQRTWQRGVAHPDAGPRGPLFPYAGGEFGSGNNMAFRRRFFFERGMFAVTLGVGTPTRGGEDLDMFRRVLLSGGALRYRPGALVHHWHRLTLSALQAQMYGYGTGMSASVTRFAMTSPRAFATILSRVPYAAWMLLSSRSPKNAVKPQDWPRGLNWIERLGYVTGPTLLLTSTIREAATPRCARGRRR